MQIGPNHSISAPLAVDAQKRDSKRAAAMMVQAKALEASFLSEMLGYAGVGATQESFGGGIGEQQFASFLRDEEAKQMVAHGGIGLAKQLFEAMQKDATK